MNAGGVPKPSLKHRAAAAVSRGVLNLGDTVYGDNPDRQAHARKDRAALDRNAYDDAAAWEYLDEVMEEHTDLLIDEDEYGTEFTDAVAREFAMKFRREPSGSEARHIQEFVSEWFREVDSRA